MLPEPFVRLALSLLQSGTLGSAETPQAGQIAAARAGLAKFLDEPRTLKTA
jgi:hypothetical protein